MLNYVEKHNLCIYTQSDFLQTKTTPSNECGLF